MSVGPDPEVHSGEDLLRLGAGIVAAYVSRNAVSADAVPDIIRTVHQTLETITRGGAAPTLAEKKASVSGWDCTCRFKGKAFRGCSVSGGGALLYA